MKHLYFKRLAPIVSIIFLLLVVLIPSVHAQNIGMNSTGTAANASAALDIDVSGLATPRGLLIPRVTLASRTAMNPLPAAAQGLTVYQTDGVEGFYYNTSTTTTPNWIYLAAGANNAWLLTGNTGTSPGTNFLGTTDNQDLQFKVNNTLSGLINIGNTNTLFGYGTGVGSGAQNSAFGFHALTGGNSGTGNAVFGWNILDINTSGSYNAGLGWQALAYNTTGGNNAALGAAALMFNDGGSNNVAIGQNSMSANLTGGQNTAVGSGSLNSNTATGGITAVGYNAMQYSTGGANVALGYTALRGSTTVASNTGGNNVGLGYASLFNNTTGSQNNATGYQALYYNTTGAGNVADGFAALLHNTTAVLNTGVGYQALVADTSGAANTSLGSYTMFSNTNGSFNTAVGYESLFKNTTGSQNTATGLYALYNNTTAGGNVANGAFSLDQDTTGGQNAGMGYGTLHHNLNGNGNVALGYEPLFNNTSAGYNVGIGYLALATQSYSNGGVAYNSLNTAVGTQALYNNQPTSTGTGAQNTAVGMNALSTNTTGSNNTAIGVGANVTSGALNNATAIGFSAQVSASNTLILGNNASVGIGVTAAPYAKLQVQGGVGNTVAYYSLNPNSKGVALVSDWPGVYFNSYYNGGTKAMAATGYPSWISTDQGSGGILFGTTNVANTTADAAVAVTERMRVDGNGNVGINTTIPLDKLHVVGNIRMVDGNQAANKVLVSDVNGTGSWQTLSSVQTNAWNLTGNSGTTAGTNFIGTTDGNDFVVKTSGTERMRVQAGGNVGIGTNAPAYLFDVADRIRLRAGSSGSAGLWLYNGTSDIGFIGDATTGHIGLWGNTGAGWGLVMNTTTGKVGIGTAAPAYPLQVIGNSGRGAEVQNSNAAGVAILGWNTAAAAANGGYGVWGVSYQSNGWSVRADNGNTNGTGLFASGNNLFGGQYLGAGSGGALNGTSTGVFSEYTGSTGQALYAYSPTNGTTVLVNYYNGTTQYKINGAGTVSTVVSDGNGSKVTLHAPESPEIYFTDYGQGQLVNGKVHIDIDPVFAKNVTINQKHPLRVYIQLEGDCNGVFVTNKSATGFDVVELKGGTSNVSFQWNIVCNRADEQMGNGKISHNADMRFEKHVDNEKIMSAEVKSPGK